MVCQDRKTWRYKVDGVGVAIISFLASNFLGSLFLLFPFCTMHNAVCPERELLHKRPAQIIIFWMYYVKTQLSWEVYKAWEKWEERENDPSVRWMDSITAVLGMGDSVGDSSSWRRSIYEVNKSWHQLDGTSSRYGCVVDHCQGHLTSLALWECRYDIWNLTTQTALTHISSWYFLRVQNKPIVHSKFYLKAFNLQIYWKCRWRTCPLQQRSNEMMVRV